MKYNIVFKDSNGAINTTHFSNKRKALSYAYQVLRGSLYTSATVYTTDDKVIAKWTKENDKVGRVVTW
jgi:hypothetical protein